MRDRHVVRGLLALPAVGGLGALLAWGFSGLPPFGDFHGFYGQLLNAIVLPQRHTTNVVTAIVFDYRGFDTMGEEFILFAAVVGVVILLRENNAGMTRAAQADFVRSDAIRFFGVPILGLVVLVGLWLAAFGLVTPGGGFQGGVAIASGIVVLYLTVGYRHWHRLGDERRLDPFEGIGAGAYVAVGIAALIAGAPFLHNLLGPGTPGTLFSGGSMSILNWAVAIEVAAANLVLYTEFLQRLVAPKELER
ncbi:MAG TPA: hydrogen gas-evolving membrane-bound hydrogenase subunit E [Gaiellaceae bacterium]